MVLPLALLNVSVARQRWRRIATVLIAAASVVPAAATLNRGMLIGLGVVVAWVALIQLRNGRYGVVAAGAVVAGGAGLVWFGSPAARFSAVVQCGAGCVGQGEVVLVEQDGGVNAQEFAIPVTFTSTCSVGEL